MNYRDALAWLYGAQAFGIKLGLENIRRLLGSAGSPHGRLRFIHVAGTNGKGSTCAMLDSVLRAAGLRCGLYTSPHLVDFRERIRVDGTLIPEVAVAEGLTLLRSASSGWGHAPTFFELATALAAWWFAREDARIVVWETGMGGRLDATNAVTPLVSVITPVAMDHEKWLGSTLAAIAREKAGIMKPGVPVVSAPQADEVRDVLRDCAGENGSPLCFVDSPCGLPLGLAGGHQRWNAALALRALDAAGVATDDSARRRGLATVSWPARFQRAGDDMVIDGAHNPQATAALVETWRAEFGARKARLVFGALQDKDPSAMLALLRAVADEVRLVPVAGPRGSASAELVGAAQSAGFSVISQATLQDALATRERGGPILVTGSLFLAGEAIALLQEGPPPLATAQ